MEKNLKKDSKDTLKDYNLLDFSDIHLVEKPSFFGKSTVIDEIQSEVINFCRDTNFLQDKLSVYDISLLDQMEFTTCVDYTISMLKKDFGKLENFYNKCVNSCLLQEKRENSFNLGYGSQCSKICNTSYEKLTNGYFDQMVRKKGIYIEFIDYKTLL